MRTFDVSKNPYDDRQLYSKTKVEFNTGLTVLVGCNGSGKSTLLSIIKDKLKTRIHRNKNDDILLIDYNDRAQGHERLMSKFSFYNDMDGLASMFVSSEGERIFQGLGDKFSGLGKKIALSNLKEIWILMDAIGSGLSIDNIDEVKDFVGFLQEENKGIDVYFVIATNEFEFAKDSDCIDVTTLGHRRFKAYNAYRNYILKSRQRKDKQMEKL